MRNKVSRLHVNVLKGILTIHEVELLETLGTQEYIFKANFKIHTLRNIYSLNFIIQKNPSSEKLKYYINSFHITVYLTEKSFKKLLAKIMARAKI